MKTENRALFRKARATNPVWDELRTAQRGSKYLTVDGFRLTDPQLDSNLTDVEFSDSELDTILPVKGNKNEEEIVSGDEVSREFLPSHSGKSDVYPAQNMLLRAGKRHATLFSDEVGHVRGGPSVQNSNTLMKNLLFLGYNIVAIFIYVSPIINLIPLMLLGVKKIMEYE